MVEKQVAAVSGPKRPSISRPKGEITRNQVFEVALDLFATRGYHATSMQAISERVGLLKGSLYYYIKSKDELLALLLENSIDDVTARMEIAEAIGGAPLDVLQAIISEEMIAIASHQREIWIWQVERRHGQQMLENVDAKARAADEILRRAVRRACCHFLDVTDNQVDLAYRAIQGLITSFTGWFRPGQELALECVIKQYCQFAIRIVDFRAEQTESS